MPGPASLNTVPVHEQFAWQIQNAAPNFWTHVPPAGGVVVVVELLVEDVDEVVLVVVEVVVLVLVEVDVLVDVLVVEAVVVVAPAVYVISTSISEMYPSNEPDVRYILTSRLAS